MDRNDILYDNDAHLHCEMVVYVPDLAAVLFPFQVSGLRVGRTAVPRGCNNR